MTEAALLAAARSGDGEAFGRLVGPLRNELRAYRYRLPGSVHDAEDAVQDTLDRAWRGLGRFGDRARGCWSTSTSPTRATRAPAAARTDLQP